MTSLWTWALSIPLFRLHSLFDFLSLGLLPHDLKMAVAAPGLHPKIKKQEAEVKGFCLICIEKVLKKYPFISHWPELGQMAMSCFQDGWKSSFLPLGTETKGKGVGSDCWIVNHSECLKPQDKAPCYRRKSNGLWARSHHLAIWPSSGQLASLNLQLYL